MPWAPLRTIEPRARLPLALALSCAVLAIAVVAFALRAPQTALFAAPLHPEQLQEVEERLAGWNVAFTPSADNVEVDARSRDALLLRLSLAGVPHAHLTGENEALASVGALTPQSVIDAQSLEGLQGDIASSLRNVSGVQDARVIVAPAKVGEFADSPGSPATASVRLVLDAGAHLGGETIAGIRSFVAAAVPGLTAARVTILDDRGVALDDASAMSGGDASDAQSALQSALDSALGAGTTIVRVHDDADRISTAIFVDTAHAGDLLSIRDLAAATVGFDAQRGDTLAVQTIDFARLPRARKDLWWLLYGGAVRLLPTLAVVVGALVALKAILPAAAAAVEKALQSLSVARAKRTAPAMEPDRVRALLAQEPPHAAAAVISALPAATAAAVLELYPQHEREAIVKRMHRRAPPLFPDPSEVLTDRH
ncbi:MAG: flagellar M-ring protein FliF C-terminal domain-containing protein [Candidatus Tyrphobacter sp.]